MEGDLQYDRSEMVRAFDETKAGVKGLTDSGLLKVPEIFLRPPDEITQDQSMQYAARVSHRVPVIDLGGVGQNPERRKRIVEEVRNASETWGFFQVVNHGIPEGVAEGMIGGTRGFHEMDAEEKKRYYTRDMGRKVRFSCNYDLFTSRTANWRDTLSISVSDRICSDELPPPCRESAVLYSNHAKILGDILFELLSEGLGLEPDHLKNMACSEGHRLHGHYYPPCPQPELAIGTARHSDAGFLTLLLQSQDIGGLQVLYEGGWVDIPPIAGALLVNIGDLLQLVSNGKFRSNEHRAMVSRVGSRISVACCFSGPVDGAKMYGPIKELISEENAPIYRDVVLREYIAKFLTTGIDKYRALDYYRL